MPSDSASPAAQNVSERLAFVEEFIKQQHSQAHEAGAAPQVKAAAAARLRAMVNPALNVLEYAMEQKRPGRG